MTTVEQMKDTINQLLVAGVKAEKNYDDSNPNVGMGPSLETLLERFLNKTTLDKESINAAKVIRMYRKMYPEKNSY